jgi:Bacterial Ig domain/PKD domain
MVSSSARRRALIATLTLFLVALALPAAALAAVPVASDSAGATRESTPTLVTLSASDDDFDVLIFAIDSAPTHGSLDDCSSGSCTYTPTAGYVGDDTFTWHANDGTDDSNIATFTMTMTPNTAPTASDIAATVGSGDTVTLFLQGADDDGDDLTFVVVDPPDHGVLGDCSGGACDYTAAAGFTGTDTFTFKANDGLADSNVATATLTITASTVTPVSSDNTGAAAVAAAMMANPAAVTGASFAAVPPINQPNGTSTALGAMPTNGSTFGLLTSGQASFADDANTSESTTGDDDGPNVRGDTDHDVTVLKIDLTVPAGANCLRLDFVFLSEEFPEYVNTVYNDGFIAELDTSTWTTAGSDITAPDNFAFDTTGAVISINSTGATGMSLANAAGTTYDGATALLQASTQTTPGSHSLYLSIFDQGDQAWDSAAFIDNIRFAAVANPSVSCAEGAAPPNTPPTSDAGGPYSGVEGASVALNGTATDVDAADTLTYLWSYAAGAGVDAGATCSFASATSVDTTVSCTDDGTFTLTLAVSDGFNSPATTDTASLTLTNANPVVSITTPTDGDIFGTGSTVSLSATITDAGANDTHTCSIAWGDGATGAGVVSGGVCSGSHPYAAAGVYTITVTVTDDDTGVGTAEVFVVISDKTVKVTGGGWIANGGRHSFGFVAKEDAAGLRGQIQVRAPAKGRFHGNVVLSLSGTGNTATWTGTGAWNGSAGYRYSVTVVDNGNGGKKAAPDTISITIRTPGGTAVVSTNGPLKGGNITIH